MPDGALLVVSKRVEQPKQVWKLLRITAWDTSQSRENELDVDVGPNDELLGWAHQEDRYDRNDQLLMDHGGNFLVVRLSKDADTWNENPNQAVKPPQSVLNIIDLRRFKLLNRVVITDPLLAAGDMGFSPSGAFIVSGLQKQSSTTIDGILTDTRQYAVQTLTLPELKPETVCSYAIVVKRYSIPPSATPEARRRIEEEKSAEAEQERNQDQAADEGCDRRLAPLGFFSLGDVRKNLNSFGMRIYSAEHSSRIPPQSPWGCDFESLSGDLKYALFDCDESRVHFTLLRWYRGFRVFNVDDGVQIMDLKAPQRPEFSGVLVTSRRVTYLFLLRDGTELKGYRVP
jgi:hypothetical protein